MFSRTMISNKGKANDNRFYNQIWNGSLSYRYKPIIIGSDLSGNPSFYMNLIIGLSIKYFGKETIENLFALWEDYKKCEKYDIFALYLLESYCYDKEVSQRPILKDLREDYAKDFLADKNDLRRKNLALRENLYYLLTMKKYSQVLDGNFNLSKKEEDIYENFHLDPATGPATLIANTIYLFEKYLSFDKENKYKLHFPINFSLFDLKGSYQLERSNKANIFKNNDSKKLNPIGNFLLKRKSAKRLYIEETFGRSLFSEEKENLINETYAKDKHKKSKIFFTKGIAKADSDKINELNSKARESNLNFYKNKENFYERIIKNLSKSIKLSLKSTEDRGSQLDKTGNLSPSLAWKSQIPNYNKIFTKKTFDKKGDYTLDILLDGSASLLYDQEIVATEAYILSRALSKNKISHRVISYSTLSDYTVLTILKDFDEETDDSRIFSYKSLGFNRDGLAFRSYTSLIPQRKLKDHLLLILTDTNPSDLRPLIKEGLSPNKAYEEDTALKDTKEELDKLRRKNIKIAALIHKENTTNATYLYYDNFYQIKDLSHFASLATRLIKKELLKK